jgi:hypothetical protein
MSNPARPVKSNENAAVRPRHPACLKSSRFIASLFVKIDNSRAVLHKFFRSVEESRNFSAILTSSANDSAPIFRISWLR